MNLHQIKQVLRHEDIPLWTPNEYHRLATEDGEEFAGELRGVWIEENPLRAFGLWTADHNQRTYVLWLQEEQYIFDRVTRGVITEKAAIEAATRYHNDVEEWSAGRWNTLESRY